MDKKTKRKKDAILAYSIAAQVAAVNGISYYGAFRILNHAKAILERNMERQRAAVPEEIRDEWGDIIEMPQADAQGKKKEVNP